METDRLCIDWIWTFVNCAAATVLGNSSNLWYYAEWACIIYKISEKILEAASKFFKNRTLYILKLFLGYIRLAKYIISSPAAGKAKAYKSYIHNTHL